MPLTIDSLGHRYDDRWIFRHLDASFPDDASVAVVGPSGVGKTTLVAALGGLLEPSEGTVCWNGRAGGVPIDQCAWILQTSNVFANRSTRDNVAAPLMLRGHDPRTSVRVANERLESLGLLEHAARPARLLSGGEVQRLGIARALALGTSVIIADEPTGQLDRATTVRTIDVLTSRRHTPCLLVVVTHDPDVAAACDQTWRLTPGGLERDG